MKYRSICCAIMLLLSFSTCASAQQKVEIRVVYENGSKSIQVDKMQTKITFSFATEGGESRMLSVQGLEALPKLNEIDLEYLDDQFDYSIFANLAQLSTLLLRDCEIMDFQILLMNSNISAVILQGCRIKNIKKQYTLPKDSRIKYVECSNGDLREPLNIESETSRSIVMNFAFNGSLTIPSNYQDKYLEVVLYDTLAQNNGDFDRDFMDLIPLEYRDYIR
jgi:hypothetical protein